MDIKPGVLYRSSGLPLSDRHLPTRLPPPLQLPHPAHPLHPLNLTIPEKHLGKGEAECEGNRSQ